ncbi:SDR family oxidoreductase [soil metagenome]
MKLEGCTALITGASAGLGREFARQLVGRASALVLVARRRDRLEELRDELTARDPNLDVLIRPADLSNAGQLMELCDGLQRDNLPLDLLINNAGLGDRGNFETGDPARLGDMLQVNVVALTTLTRALLSGMLARKRGAVLNVSSCASFLPMPGFAVYAATKAYVTSFSEALRMELRGSGVTVTALCPGPVHTEFDGIARRATNPDQRAAPELAYVPVEKVVRDGLEGVARTRPIIIPGVVMKLAMTAVRLTPMPLFRMAGQASAPARHS